MVSARGLITFFFGLACSIFLGLNSSRVFFYASKAIKRVGALYFESKFPDTLPSHVGRSLLRCFAHVAQLVEHSLGKGEVPDSSSGVGCHDLYNYLLSTLVAQLVEHRIPNPRVGGSSPSGRALFIRHSSVSSSNSN